jgi:hypothetical protein
MTYEERLDQIKNPSSMEDINSFYKLIRNNINKNFDQKQRVKIWVRAEELVARYEFSANSDITYIAAFLDLKNTESNPLGYTSPRDIFKPKSRKEQLEIFIGSMFGMLAYASNFANSEFNHAHEFLYKKYSAEYIQKFGETEYKKFMDNTVEEIKK